MSNTTNTILIADDSEEDVELLLWSLRNNGIINPVQIVRDGKQAMEYLFGHGPYADRKQFPFPGILLLDLRMPNMDGFEVLALLGKDPQFRRMLIVVLTGHDERHFITRAYDLGANSFLTKPVYDVELHNLIDFFKGWWTVEQPDKNSKSRRQNETSGGEPT